MIWDYSNSVLWRFTVSDSERQNNTITNWKCSHQISCCVKQGNKVQDVGINQLFLNGGKLTASYFHDIHDNQSWKLQITVKCDVDLQVGFLSIWSPLCHCILQVESVTFKHKEACPHPSQLVLWVPKHTFNALRIRFKSQIPIELYYCNGNRINPCQIPQSKFITLIKIIDPNQKRTWFQGY